MLPKDTTTKTAAESASQRQEAEMQRPATPALEAISCVVCEAKRDCKKDVKRENLVDLKIRAQVTFAYAKATGEIPNCEVCKSDYFHCLILGWRGRDELLLEHNCVESNCANYVKNSWLILPHGGNPLRHSKDFPVVARVDKDKCANELQAEKPAFDEVDMK